MALVLVCLVLQLLFLLPSTNAAENDSCISSDYEELKRALRDNDTSNIQTLLNAFYRPNTQDIQVAEITYCISDNKTFCSNEDGHNFEYKWASSALLFLQEYELINALVFDLFQFNYTTVSLIISPPFCEDVDEENIKNNLRLLTTWLKHYTHSDDNNELQDYAVHFNSSKGTFDIEVYKKIKKLHYSLLALKYTMVIFTFITLLLRICSKGFAIEIDTKLEKVNKSFSLSKISNFIRGIQEEMDDNNEGRSETSEKKSYEYTASYFILLVGFFVWDSIQYKNSKNSEKLQKEDWYLFFPIPYIAPTVIGVSTVISIILYFVIIVKNKWSSRAVTGTKSSTHYEPLSNNEATGDDNIEAAGDDSNDVCMEGTNININMSTVSSDNEYYVNLDKKPIPTRATCTCHRRDCIHFPILTGLSVFIIFHGSWMLLMLSAYSNIVIIKSLFLLPTFCFIMVLLPRFIKASCNFIIDRCYRRDICSECKKCKICLNNKTKGISQGHPNQPNGIEDPSQSSGGQGQPNQPNGIEDPSQSSGRQGQPNRPNGIEDPSLSSGGQGQPNQPNGIEDPSQSSGGQGNPNRPNGNKSNPKNHYKCNDCIKCDTCSQRRQCHQPNVCHECNDCCCNICQRCIHCKECTLCEDCKNCKDCKQCRSCQLSNFFKLCRECINEKKEHKKSFTTIYGFIVIVAITVPLLFVLYYGSDYILFVTDIHDDLLKLLIALAVLLGVPYYLIRIWDNDISGKKNAPINHQPPTNNGEHQPPTNQPPTNQPPTNQPPTNNGEHQPPPQDALADVTQTRERSETV